MNQPSHISVCLALMETLAQHGTHHAVISPGSRNTPLVLAADAVPTVQTHVVIDERSAAFVALGIARATGSSVGLICTSGSALAHYLPALIEAERSGLVIVVLSADRPTELLGCRAPQTLRQLGLLDGAVRCSRALHASDPATCASDSRTLATEMMTRAIGEDPGPVHINVHLREPLWAAHHVYVASEVVAATRPATELTAESEVRVDDLAAAAAGKRVLVIAGPRLDGNERNTARLNAWRELMRRTGWPVLADPVSGLRWSADLPVLTTYDNYLRNPEIRTHLKPDVILHIGGMPTCKALYTWLGDLPIPQHQVQQSPEPANIGHRATSVLLANETAVIERLIERLDNSDHDPPRALTEWSTRWRDAEAAASCVIERGMPDEAALIVRALQAAERGHTICVASSMPIRDADAYGSLYAGPVRMLANRGANGIDGLIATAAGVAIGSGKPATLIIGDVAFAHDISGLAAAVRLGASLHVHVIDNGGGGIFSYLPIAGLGDGFEEFFVTPPRMDISAVAAALGAHVQLPDTEAQSDGDLTGPRVTVTHTDKQKNLKQHADIVSQIQSQVLRTFGMS